MRERRRMKGGHNNGGRDLVAAIRDFCAPECRIVEQRERPAAQPARYRRAEGRDPRRRRGDRDDRARGGLRRRLASDRRRVGERRSPTLRTHLRCADFSPIRCERESARGVVPPGTGGCLFEQVKRFAEARSKTGSRSKASDEQSEKSPITMGAHVSGRLRRIRSVDEPRLPSADGLGWYLLSVGSRPDSWRLTALSPH